MSDKKMENMSARSRALYLGKKEKKRKWAKRFTIGFLCCIFLRTAFTIYGAIRRGIPIKYVFQGDIFKALSSDYLITGVIYLVLLFTLIQIYRTNNNKCPKCKELDALEEISRIYVKTKRIRKGQDLKSYDVYNVTYICSQCGHIITVPEEVSV